MKDHFGLSEPDVDIDGVNFYSSDGVRTITRKDWPKFKRMVDKKFKEIRYKEALDKLCKNNT